LPKLGARRPLEVDLGGALDLAALDLAALDLAAEDLEVDPSISGQVTTSATSSTRRGVGMAERLTLPGLSGQALAKVLGANCPALDLGGQVDLGGVVPVSGPASSSAELAGVVEGSHETRKANFLCNHHRWACMRPRDAR
jgi:hypothetical protein